MAFLGLRKRRIWNEIFSNCDFEFARALLIHSFAGGVIPKGLARLLDLYNNKPCRKTAIGLIEFDKHEFLKFFVNNRTVMKQMLIKEGVNKEQLLKRLHKNVALLHQDSDFQAYCAAFLESDPRAILQEKKAALIEKGYSQEMIHKAVSEHMQGL